MMLVIIFDDDDVTCKVLDLSQTLSCTCVYIYTHRLYMCRYVYEYIYKIFTALLVKLYHFP